MNIQEPARDIPVVDDVDLCVLGGSTTGVFAAVAAARQGEELILRLFNPTAERLGWLAATG